MEYLYFPEQSLSEYDLDATLLNHSRISQSNRARLFSWLSQECTKQNISRYSFSLTCAYIDLFFMKKKDVQLKNYQILALGALILATKQAQIEGKIPIIDLNLFKAEQLLEMEKKIIYALDFYLNPPVYIELLNNIAKMWDSKCQAGQIRSKVRYFEPNLTSYLSLKSLYEKMDCLNLYFGIEEVVVTLFYLQTKLLDKKLRQSKGSLFLTVEQFTSPEVKYPIYNPQDQEQVNFKAIFVVFLAKSQIKTQLNDKIEKIVSLFTDKNFPINDETPKCGRTFVEMSCMQTYNVNGHEFYRKYQAQITKL